jgi:outer membrane protein assembly factor BamB
MKMKTVWLGLILSVCAMVRADDWPQWLGPQRDGIWREKGIIEKFPAGGAKILWRTPIAAGYAGPAAAEGRVYVTDRVAAADKPGDPFQRGKYPGLERVFCINASDGNVIWQKEYSCDYTMSYALGPRATPVISDGKVYTVGGEGDVRCYKSDNGELVWSKKFNDDGSQTPMWGYSSSPLVDGDKLICVATASSIAVAFNKKNGEIIWKSLSGKEPGYAPPVIFEAGGKRQLIIWHPAAIVSLDPENGKEYWTEKLESKMGLSIATPKKMGNMLFVSSAYEGATMMQFDESTPAAKRLWHRGGRTENTTDAIHMLIPSPALKDGYVYGVEIYGQLRCLKAENGDRLWETFKATTEGERLRWATAFIVQQGDRFILANDQGDLIIANMSPKGYEEISRAHVIAPTNPDANRPVVWSHPAFANKCVYWRNDKEIVCVSMEEGK